MKKIFLIITALLLTASVFAQSTVGLKMPDELILEFRYENADAETVAISGTFNGWGTDTDMMTKDADGIWTFQMPVDASSNVTFKYVVNGEYLGSMEGLAPATSEDGYGGKNGVIAVADLAAGGDEGEDAPFRTKLTYGNYTELFSETHFRTTSIAPNSDGDYEKGFEASSSALKAKSYWKFTADILPGINTFMEMKVFDGQVSIFEQAPGATADAANTLDPTLPVKDGMQNLSEILFGPFYAFNSNAKPEIGHFKAGMKTSYVNLSTGYNYAKSDILSRELIYNTFENDKDANDGYLEISNGSKIASIGNIGLNTTVAFTKRAGGHGIYSWVDLLGLGPLDLSVTYNSLANRLEDNTLEYFMFDARHTLGLGLNAQGLVPDMVNLKAEALVTYDPLDDKFVAEDAIAAGLVGDFSAGNIFKTGFYTKYAGPNVTTFFGDDSADDYTIDKSLFKAGVSPSSMPIDLLKVGVNYDLEMAYTFDGDITNKINPWVDLYLASVLGLDSTVNAYTELEIVGSDTDFTEAGGTVTLKELAMLSELRVGYKNDLTSENDDYIGDIYVSAHTKELGSLSSLDVELGYTNDSVAVTAQAGMDNIIINGGMIYRLEDEVSPFGVALGGFYTLSEKYRQGRLFVQTGYEFMPYDKMSDPLMEYDSNFLKKADGQGDAYVSCGISWNF